MPFNQAELLLDLLGTTASTFPLGRLHFRRLQLQVIQVIRNGRHLNAWVTQQTAQDLRWWLHPQLWQERIPFQLPPLRQAWRGHGPASVTSAASNCVRYWLLSRSCNSGYAVLSKQDCLIYDPQHDSGGILIASSKEGHGPAPSSNCSHSGRGQCSGGHGSRVGPTIPTEWTLTTRGYQWICSRSRWAHRHCNYSQTKPTTSLLGMCSRVRMWKHGRQTHYSVAGRIRILAVQYDVEVPQETTCRDNISHSTGSNVAGSCQVGSSVMHFPHLNDGELSNRGPASLTTALGPRARASPNSPQSPTDTYGKGFLKEQRFLW